MAKTYSGQQIIRILVREFGFVVVSQKGSHVKLKQWGSKGDSITIVPLHREVARGTLRGILELAPIDYQSFEKVIRG